MLGFSAISQLPISTIPSAAVVADWFPLSATKPVVTDPEQPMEWRARAFPFDTLTPVVTPWFPFSTTSRQADLLADSAPAVQPGRRFPPGLFGHGGWMSQARRRDQGVVLEPTPVEPPKRYPTFPGTRVQLLFVQRDPDAPQRTRQHIDLVAEILNSLIRQGILRKTGQNDWIIDL